MRSRFPDYDKDIYNFDQQTGVETFIKCNTNNTFFGKNKSTSKQCAVEKICCKYCLLISRKKILPHVIKNIVQATLVSNVKEF